MCDENLRNWGFILGRSSGAGKITGSKITGGQLD